MELFKGFVIMVTWLMWLAGSVLSKALGGWWGLIVYIVGSACYAAWTKMLRRSLG